MTEEVKPVEVKVEEKKQEAPAPVSKIAVDLDGISIEVDHDTAKKLIEARQKAKKDVASLKEQLSKAEAAAKDEASKAALMKAMKDSDVESVKSQVAAEYLDKIAKYERKIFYESTKTALVAAGILPEAADDAVSLALHAAKPVLDGDVIKINDKPLNEFVAEFVKSKPHLVSVKTTDKKPLVKIGQPPKPAANPFVSLQKAASKLQK